MKDYYAALGIAANATIAEIKSAYRKKASQLHPDKNTSSEAPAKFREVQEAYEIWQYYLNGILKKWEYRVTLLT